jgi:hypothetical protein
VIFICLECVFSPDLALIPFYDRTTSEMRGPSFRIRIR